MTDREFEEIKNRNAARTPGAWCWVGNTKNHSVELVSRKDSFSTVLMFKRWGMSNAQPMFRSIEAFNGSNSGLLYSLEGISTSGLIRYEVDYRKDFYEIDHPDAIFLANAAGDVDKSIAEIEQLKQKIQNLESKNV